jgi:hypothetical protein
MAATSSGAEGAVEHNVPAPLASMVGRARELQAIGETLRRTRLVTLTGPGGRARARARDAVTRRLAAGSALVNGGH